MRATLPPVPAASAPPIPVSFLPAAVLRLPGRLGLTQAPGTWDCDLLPTWYLDQARVARDLASLATVHGVDALLTLQEEDEMAGLGLSMVIGMAVSQGIQSLWLPIPDGRAPAVPADAADTVDQVVALLAAGKTVAIHCLAGLGRSGTMAACVLVRLGVRPGLAIERVRAARPGAVQTSEQEQFVRRYARFVSVEGIGVDNRPQSVAGVRRPALGHALPADCPLPGAGRLS